MSIKLQNEEIPFRINHSEAKAIFISKNYIEKLLAKSSEFENKDLFYLYLDDDKDYFIEQAKKQELMKTRYSPLKKS